MKDNIKKVLRFTRHKKGISQEKIATDLGISIPALSKIETGVTDISLSRFIQIANYYEISPHLLLFRIQTGNPDAILDAKVDVNVIKSNKEFTERCIHLQSKLIELYEELRAKNMLLNTDTFKAIQNTVEEREAFYDLVGVIGNWLATTPGKLGHEMYSEFKERGYILQKINLKEEESIR